MTATALLDRARSAGVEFYRRLDGSIGCRGPKPALEGLLPEIREHRDELLALLAANDPDPAHRLWSIALPSGERISASYCPAASAVEVRELWPDAASIEPEDEPATGGTLEPGDEATIRAWLASIAETDPITVGEVLAKAAADPAALGYYLDRATAAGIAPQPETTNTSTATR